MLDGFSACPIVACSPKARELGRHRETPEASGEHSTEMCRAAPPSASRSNAESPADAPSWPLWPLAAPAPVPTSAGTEESEAGQMRICALKSSPWGGRMGAAEVAEVPLLTLATSDSRLVLYVRLRSEGARASVRSEGDAVRMRCVRHENWKRSVASSAEAPSVETSSEFR